MVPTIIEIEIHHTSTRQNKRQYQFTPKHHGRDPGAACWLPELTREEEFTVFDVADFTESFDDDGNYYGVLREADGRGLRYLGTWNQQIAKFPYARDGEAWHGYPLYPLAEPAPPNRSGDKLRPAKSVFFKLFRAAMITKRDRKRLMKGDPV
jgi:hypothetical protein